MPRSRFSWLRGEDSIEDYKLEDGWGPRRCVKCGSPMPDTYDGQRMWVPAGLMDDTLDTDFKLHIFCGSRADWDQESPEARYFDEAPTGG